MRMPNAIASPQNYARFAGIIYLLLIIAGGLDETLIRNTIIAPGDPLATANNIMAHDLGCGTPDGCDVYCAAERHVQILAPSSV